MNLCCQLGCSQDANKFSSPTAIFQSSKSILIPAGEMYYLENIKHHISDMRDSHEYTYRSKCDGVSRFLQDRVAENQLTEAFSIVYFDFEHFTYLGSIYVLMDVAQI